MSEDLPTRRYAESDEEADEELRPIWGFDDLSWLLSESRYYEPPGARAPYGRYRDRPLIGPDARIRGGLRWYKPDEHVVVDDADVALDKVYAGVRTIIDAANALDRLQIAFKAVNDEVRRLIPYDEDVRAEVRSYGRALLKVRRTHNAIISLTHYLREKGGVCRHQALLTSYLLERLCDDRVIVGRASYDACHLPVWEMGHAWTRFTDHEGRVWIIDPTRNVLKRLEDLQRPGEWPYARPSDWARFPPDMLVAVQLERWRHGQRLRPDARQTFIEEGEMSDEPLSGVFMIALGVFGAVALAAMLTAFISSFLTIHYL